MSGQSVGPIRALRTLNPLFGARAPKKAAAISSPLGSRDFASGFGQCS